MNFTGFLPGEKPFIKLKDKIINPKHFAFVMGIVNATPDSFFEKSRGGADYALNLVQQGADILDIGAESTRPGSAYISEEEELKRLIPVIKEIRRYSNVPISVDTRRLNVMKAAFEQGADILNDISALEDEPELADFCAEKSIPVILMHKRGSPVDMQKNTAYTDVCAQVSSYLESRIAFALEKGIKSDKIIVDPGIGFSKDYDSNIALIKNCGNLCSKKYPVLMALSRKTVIREICNTDVENSLYGSLAANIMSVLNGAFMIRVHDVKATVDACKVLEKLSEV